MAHWLYKSEPSAWSWDDQVNAGTAGTPWTGVRNHLAKQNLMKMKLGDTGFFYHSNAGKDVVGIAEVCALAHPDSTADNPTWECVDIRAVADIPNPINLDDIKADPALAKMILVNNSRLSVQPVTDEEYLHICKRCGLDNPPKSP